MAKNSAESKNWDSLPQDIVEKIKSYFIELHDIYKFRSVCKEWRQAFCPEDGFGSAWLVQKHDDDSILKLFHPLADMSVPYQIHVPLDVDNAYLHGCRDGWLLMSINLNNMFFYNPLSKSTVSLPKIPPCNNGEFYGFTCTSAPTSKDCLALVTTKVSYDDHHIVEIFTIAKGKSDWIKTEFTPDYESIVPCQRNPVYSKGKFYFVGSLGDLGVFDPYTRTWMQHDCDPNQYKMFDEGYLLDMDGVLAYVLTTTNLKIAVFKWDECNLNWQAVKDVGEYTFFLSYKTSFAKKDKRSYMRNRIYLPIKYKQHGLFYSLDDSWYHTSQHDLRNPVINQLCKCCWFEPVQHHCSSKLLEWIPDTTLDECSS